MGEPDLAPTADLLHRWSGGDARAGEELYGRIHAALHERAHALLLYAGRPGPMATASLVHEAWLKLVEPGAGVAANDRDHFLRLAVRAMRSVVVDRARAQGTRKRGGGAGRVSFADVPQPLPPERDFVLDLDAALTRLARLDPRRHQVAELRLFGELEHGEIARLTGTSARTVERIWRATRAWLERELESASGREEA